MDYELQSKELKVKIQKEVTTYLTYSLPLCAILSDERLYPWLYQHFVQIYTLTDEKGNLWVDYLEDRNFYKDVLEYSIYPHEVLKDVSDIMKFIADKINAGYYVIIFLDEYYLPKKASYMKYHFLHQLMIYGYDDQSQTIKTIAFNEKREFINIEYSYEQIVQAYEEGRKRYPSAPVWVLNETVEVFRPKALTNAYAFDLALFLDELETYLLAQGEYSRIRPNNLQTNGTKASFNFSIYDELIHHLDNLIDGKMTMDYRYIHLLFEHKVLMYRRLEHILSNFRSSPRLSELLGEYSKVVKRMESVRNVFLRWAIALAEGKAMSEEASTDTFQRVQAHLRMVKEQEQKILSEFCTLLKE